MKPLTLWNKSFGDPIVQMMFFIFVFCATINYYGLSKFISLWFITRKFVVGRSWMFTFVFLASMFILGGLTSASPAAIIGWSILYGVCEVCGYKKGDGYPTMMVFGIVFASQLGMSLIPFKQAALTVLSAYTTLSGTHIDYAKYMLIAAIICTICCGLFVLIGKYIFNPDMPGDKATFCDWADCTGTDFQRKPLEVEIGELIFGGAIAVNDTFESSLPNLFCGSVFLYCSGAMSNWM